MSNPTRRHPWREFAAVMRAPLTMFEAKHRDPRGPVRFSMFRVIVGMFAWAFYSNWPQEWTRDSWVALALILFALPIDTLMAKVPASEATEALSAVFSSFAAKSAAGAAERLHGAYGTMRAQGDIDREPTTGGAG